MTIELAFVLVSIGFLSGTLFSWALTRVLCPRVLPSGWRWVVSESASSAELLDAKATERAWAYPQVDTEGNYRVHLRPWGTSHKTLEKAMRAAERRLIG